MELVYLGLGTNQGDRLGNLQKAIDLLEERIAPIEQKSQIYQTAAWGIEDQAPFLNMVIKLSTLLGPKAILKAVLAIEADMGRERKQKWGERLIDIDILFFGNQILETPELIIPHPFIQERNFVLVPMAELAPDFVHPIHQKSIRLLKEVSLDQLKVSDFLGEEE